MKKRRLKYTPILFAFFCMMFVFGTNAYAFPPSNEQKDKDTTCNSTGENTETEGTLFDTSTNVSIPTGSIGDEDVVPPDNETTGVDKIEYETQEGDCLDNNYSNCTCPEGMFWDDNLKKCTTRDTGSTMNIDESDTFRNPNWKSDDELLQECEDEKVPYDTEEYQCTDDKGRTIVLENEEDENQSKCTSAVRLVPVKKYKEKYTTDEELAACVNAKKPELVNDFLGAGREWATETISGACCDYIHTFSVPFWVNDVQIIGTINFKFPKENPNAYVFQRSENGKTLIYYYDGKYGSTPTLYEPTIELASSHYGSSNHISIIGEAKDGNEPAIWKKNQYETNKLKDTKSYYFYILNIDNPSSKYYNRNGRYKLLSKNKTGAIGPNSCNEVTDPECEIITLTSAQNDAQGINYVKRVRFQDEYYDVLVYSSYNYIIYLRDIYNNGAHYASNYTAALVNSALPGTWINGNYLPPGFGSPIKTCTINRYLKPTKEIVKKMGCNSVDERTTTNLLEVINTHQNEKNKYLNLDTWNELEELKEIANVNVYGGYNASGDVNIGEIAYNQLGEPNEEGLVAGSWIYKQKRQPKEISQAYLLYPTVKYEERTYTICIGKYNCQCEDINVLCSCEDEEAGCPPDIGAPEGNGDEDDGCPQGPVADNYGADETNPKVYNEKGMSVLSGGCGGITGKGSTDYMDKYLTIGSTIIQ